MANKNTIPLGIRINNPANIRYNPRNSWIGQCGSQKGFCKFSHIDYGIRALIKLLYRYRKNGLYSIRQIISRYAPPCENNTEGYISYVCSRFGDVSPDYIVDLSVLEYTFILCSAILKQESGYDLTQLQFDRSFNLLSKIDF